MLSPITRHSYASKCVRLESICFGSNSFPALYQASVHRTRQTLRFKVASVVGVGLVVVIIGSVPIGAGTNGVAVLSFSWQLSFPREPASYKV